jgi:hypothetical protein
MARTKLTLEEWQDSVPLFIETINTMEVQLLKRAKTLRKQLSKYEALTEIERAKLLPKLYQLCNDMQKETWERFLKRRRDNRYESKSARKRLSLHNSTHDAVTQYAKENQFTDTSQAVEYLLQYALKATSKIQSGVRIKRPQDMDIVKRRLNSKRSK